MRLIKMLLVCSMIVALAPVAASAEGARGTERSVKNSPRIVQQGMAALRSLVETHPDRLVSRTLSEWIGSSVIPVSMESDLMPAEMAMGLVDIGGTTRLVLVVNPLFILRPQKNNAKDDLLYKQLVVYHETKHADDHMSGRILLTSSVAQDDPKDIAAKARNIWRAEYSATFAEWKFAERISATHLMSSFKKMIAIHGERRGFLEAFAPLIFRGAMVSDPRPFLPHWKKLYQEEKKRLH